MNILDLIDDKNFDINGIKLKYFSENQFNKLKLSNDKEQTNL